MELSRNCRGMIVVGIKAEEIYFKVADRGGPRLPFLEASKYTQKSLGEIS